MKNLKHYLIMWIAFGVLFTIARFGLEVLEGTKITTTEFMGLRDLGLFFMFIMATFVFLLYPISFLPLTIIISKFVKSLIVKVVIFTCIGGMIGVLAFKEAYSWQDDYFIVGYDLRISTAIIIFSIAGLLYALVENFLKNKVTFSSN